MTLLLLLGCLYLALGLGIFLYACHRGKDTDWTNQAAVDKTMFKAYWDVVVRAREYLENQNVQDVSITSRDGLTLRGLWLPAEQPKATVICFHGYRSSYLVDFSGIYRLYHDWGFNLLLVNQRSHGSSEGKFITFGVKERLDALEWIRFHNRTFGAIPLFLSGMSMGAATVAFAAGENLPENVKGLTIDCGFTSPHDIIRKVGSESVGNLIDLFMPCVNLWANLLAGIDLRQCHSTQTLARCQKPVLMIHGLSDDYVPSYMTQEGYNACASEKTLILVEGAGHGTSFITDRPRVEGALHTFFHHNIPNDQHEVPYELRNH